MGEHVGQLPDHLRPDRARYPQASDAEWQCVLAVLWEAAGRGPLPRLLVLVDRQLPADRPWLVTDSDGNVHDALARLDTARQVAITPMACRVVMDVAQADQQHGGGA
jgi:hypothetical protein